MRNRLVLALVLVMMAMPIASRAGNATIIDTTLVANQWFAARIRVTDPSAAMYQDGLELHLGDVRIASAGIAILSPGEAGGAFATVYNSDEFDCHASLDAASVCDQRVARPDSGGETLSVGGDGDSFPESGDYYVIAMLTAKDGVASAELRLTAGAGVTLVAQDQGAAFIFGDEDFGGSPNVTVGAGPIGAQLISGGEIDKDITHSFFGWFGTNVLNPGLTCSEPGRNFPCATPRMDRPPGEYKFKVDQSSPSDVPPHTWLWGADVALPY